jgi:hypothetical protein
MHECMAPGKDMLCSCIGLRRYALAVALSRAMHGHGACLR